MTLDFNIVACCSLLFLIFGWASLVEMRIQLLMSDQGQLSLTEILKVDTVEESRGLEGLLTAA